MDRGSKRREFIETRSPSPFDPKAFRRRRWVAGIFVGLALVCGGLSASPELRGRTWRIVFGGPNAIDHANERLPVINAELAAATGGFIMTAGDSHANRFGRLALCHLPMVNAGVDGAGARVYARVTDSLAAGKHAAAIVLTIGTNDLLAKNKPSNPDRMARLAAQDRAIIAKLAARTDRLVVTAIPPVAERVAGIFDLEALEELSRELQKACRSTSRCAFIDPFRPLRSVRFGLAQPAALHDDLHLADYAEAARRLEPMLCTGLRPFSLEARG